MDTISVNEPNATKIIQARKILTAWHPLLSYHPDQWKNIPVMVVSSIKDIIASIILGSENLFEFEIKQNSRMHKLQGQLTKYKVSNTKEMTSLKFSVEQRLKDQIFHATK